MRHHAAIEMGLPIGYNYHDNSNAKDPMTALQAPNQMSTRPMPLRWIAIGTTPQKKAPHLEMSLTIPLEVQKR
jgi:hypothetical protein